MITSNKIKTVWALTVMAITGFAFNVTAKDMPALQPDPTSRPASAK